MGHPAHGAFLLLDALLLLFRPPQVHRHRRTPWPRRAPYSKPAKRRDERRYSRLPAWQTLPANDRSAEQIASVLLWRNLVGLYRPPIRMTGENCSIRQTSLNLHEFQVA